MTGMIYVIRTEPDNGLWKIGFTTNLGTRLVSLRQRFGEVVVTAAAQATQADEYWFHRHNRESHVSAEWYGRTPEVKRFVAYLRRNGRLPKVGADSVSSLITERGGIRPVARKLGHSSHTTVQSWVERNRIPEAQRDAVMALPVLEAAR